MKDSKFKQLLHLIAGLLLIYHGFNSLELHHFLASYLMIGFGCFFLFAAGTINWLSKKFKKINSLIIIVESAVLSYSGWIYYINEGSKNKSWALLMALLVILYFFSGIYFLFKKTHSKKVSRSRTSK
jgi:uncharacterized membrane protein YfcA